jgi:hypothetical protein
MNFQPVKQQDHNVENAFVSFCIKSKPYDFCSLPTMSARLFRIKDYYDFLLREKNCFFLGERDFVDFFIALDHSPTGVYVDFVFGPPFKLQKYFENFRKFYRGQHQDDLEFRTILKRQHKKSSFVRAIKKRDASARFSVDNDEIHVSWVE